MPSAAPTVFPKPPTRPPTHAPPTQPPGPPGPFTPTERPQLPRPPAFPPIDPVVLCQEIRTQISGATRASELQVLSELNKLHAGMDALRLKADKVVLALSQRNLGVRSIPLAQDAILSILTDVEQRWDAEIKLVKRELHQTILAHNHNADLMADHKVILDQLLADIEAHSFPKAGSEHQEGVQRLTAIAEDHASQDQELDELLQRSEALFQQAERMGLIPPAVPPSVPSLRPAPPSLPATPAALRGLLPPAPLAPPGILSTLDVDFPFPGLGGMLSLSRGTSGTSRGLPGFDGYDGFAMATGLQSMPGALSHDGFGQRYPPSGLANMVV